MRQAVGWLMVGVILLGGVALAGNGSGVRLPPAEEEIAAMEKAFGQVTGFFAELITELKGAVAALNAVDKDLAARLNEMANRLADMRRHMDIQLADYESRITALEKLDLGSLHRRVLALEQSAQALQIKIENNRHKIEGVEATLAGFSADIAAQNRAIADLKSRVDSQATRIDEVEATVAATVEALDVPALREAVGTAQMLGILGLLLGAGALLLVLLG